MIDIHSHILPGVDDGVQTLEDALEMLRISAAGGIRVQVLTPHIHPGRFDNTKAFLQKRFDAFTESVDRAGIEIELRLAAEVHVGPEIMTMLANDTLPWLGEYRDMKTFLLEFPLTNVPAGSLNLVDWLVQRDVLPVIVHPERCREWQRHPERIQPYVDAGCPLQITASSLCGKFGANAQDLAIDLLRSTSNIVAATDCHNLSYRPPDLIDGHRQAAHFVGEDRAMRLVTTAPGELLSASMRS